MLRKVLNYPKIALRATCLFLINFYQVFLSPQLGFGCRFHPSCSEYAKQCFSTGEFHWAFLSTLKRLLKCRPCGDFGYDPIPQKRKITCE